MLPNCRVYFANHKSKTTQWEDPRRSMVDQLPLPHGWEIRFSADNRKYFIDHNTKTTTYKGTVFERLITVIVKYCDSLTDPRSKTFEDESATSAGPIAAYERSFKWKVGHFRHLCTVSHTMHATKILNWLLLFLSLSLLICYVQANKLPQSILIPVSRSNVFEESFNQVSSDVSLAGVMS